MAWSKGLKTIAIQNWVTRPKTILMVGQTKPAHLLFNQNETICNGWPLLFSKEKSKTNPSFFYTKHAKAKLPCKAKIHCKDHHSRDKLMMLLPGSVCSPCKAVPHVIPSPYPPSETGCSTATETAAKSSSSTWELQAITPGTYTWYLTLRDGPIF